MNHPLIVISGPKCAGKTTLAAHLMHEFANLARVVTYTTRDPQIGETRGHDYIYVNKEEFEKLESEQSFIETTTTSDGNRFGTKGRDLMTLLARQPTILVLNPEGADSIHSIFPDAHFIFVVAPPEDTERRLLYRSANLREYPIHQEEVREETLAVRHSYYSCIVNNPDSDIKRPMKQLKRFVYGVLNP